MSHSLRKKEIDGWIHTRRNRLHAANLLIYTLQSDAEGKSVACRLQLFSMDTRMARRDDKYPPPRLVSPGEFGRPSGGRLFDLVRLLLGCSWMTSSRPTKLLCQGSKRAIVQNWGTNIYKCSVPCSVLHGRDGLGIEV